MIKDKEKYRNIGVKTNSKTFKSWYNTGLLNDIDEDYVDEIQNFWIENYEKEVNPLLNMAFMNLTGKKDLRLIPSNIIQREIFPVFNDYNVTSFYGDKNFYDTIITSPYAAETIFRNIRGNFFDADYNNIDIENAQQILVNSCMDMDLVIKPSKSNNGTGVRKLSIRENKIYLNGEEITFEHLLEVYKRDFIIQKVIQQHPNMAAPHPASVNTIRMVTFRWKDEIRYLFGFARFGANNDIRDNANVDISPRLGITDSGEFFDIGLSQDGQKFTHHPTTGFCFADLDPIPNYEEFKQFVKDNHKHFLHLDIISWDIAVGLDGKPIFLETNFAGTTSFYQLVTQRPFFGDLTEEVLQYVSSEWESRKPKLMKKHRNRIARRKRRIEQREKKKMKKQKLSLEKQLKIKEKELEQMDKKYKDILKSKSFRYTRPLRNISRLLK